MPLQTPQLQQNILSILTDMESREADAKEEFADRLSKAIETFVKTATVNAGIAVSTTGTATAQTGATTGTGTLS